MTDEDDRRLAEYLAFAAEHPQHFRAESDGAIRILLDPSDIREVEAEMARSLRAQGLPESGGFVGVIVRDPYYFFIRDAVEFPDGSRRTYARIINRVGNGTAVLGMLGERMVLLRHFRHGIRRWSLEIPRGGIEADQTPETAAHAEVREELGGEIEELVPLGFLYGSTNLYGNGAHLFFARLNRTGAPQLAEGITQIVTVTAAEFERMLRDGEIVDSFTIAAFTHARLRGLV